jgi:hypothetical protein
MDLLPIGVAIFGGLCAGVIIRTAALRASLTMFRESNEELRKEVAYREQLCQKQVGDLRADSERKIGELSGKVDLLSSAFMADLHANVRAAVKAGVSSALAEGNGTSER